MYNLNCKDYYEDQSVKMVKKNIFISVDYV